jgi:hypothetical protein
VSSFCQRTSAQPSGLGKCASKFSGLKGRDKRGNLLIANIVHGFSAVKS